MDDLKILIIDDMATDRMAIRRHAQQLDIVTDIHDAGTLEKALGIDAPEIDAIFLDYMMPDGTGLDAMSRILQRWPRAAIILITGQGSEELAKSAILLGAADYVPKGVLSQDVVRRILENAVGATRAKWRIKTQQEDLNTFSDMLVHDLRAPVRSIAFLAGQIREDFDDGADAEARDGLRLLSTCATQLSEMIASLSTHISCDRDIEPVPVSPANLVDRALVALDRDIVDAGAVIDVEIAEGLAQVTCDPPQIAQLLQNLIANAIKYRGAARPRIGVRVAPGESGSHVFEVIDNGIGVPDEYRERIFEPFRRAPGVGDVEGTGLGLATCRRIVERHRGRIACHPAPDQGTCMRVLIPRNIVKISRDAA